MDGSQGVVDFVAQHLHQALPCLTLLLAQRAGEVGEDHQVVREAAFPEHAASQFPAAALAGEGVLHEPRRFALEALLQSQVARRLPDQLLGRPPQQSRPATVGRLEGSGFIEREGGHVDLFHDLREQGGGLHGVQSLAAQRLAQRVDFDHGEPEGVIAPVLTGPNGVVPFVQGGEHVGHRLQRADDSMSEHEGESHPRRGDHDGEGPLHPRREVAVPQQQE